MNNAELAGALTVGAVTLVRRLRAADRRAQLTGPQASALGIIVYAGSIRLSQLAQLEEVSRPAITKTVTQLEGLELVTRVKDDGDRRASLLSPTVKGRRLFQDGHARRTAPLAAAIAELTEPQRQELAAAVHILEVLNDTIQPEPRG